MIYVRLAGGIGNQLYQLAAAEYISRKVGTGFTPVISGLERYTTPRSPDSLEVIESERLEATITRGFQALCCDRLRFGRWLPHFGLNDRIAADDITSIDVARRSNLYMDGYFQNCWNYQTFQNTIRSWRIALQATNSNHKSSTSPCAIHIRGGDFLRIPQHQVIDENYYFHCIKCAMDLGFDEFEVITDDSKYASEIINSIKRSAANIHIHISKSTTPLDDFQRLRVAKARIIGNSTFAWWAAALDPSEAITWSPSKFTRSTIRRWHLPWEIVTDVNSYPT